MTLTKKQRRLFQKKCKHYDKSETFVTFCNGTKHLEVRCVLCKKFFGYKQQGKHDTNILPVNRLSGLIYDDQEDDREIAGFVNDKTLQVQERLAPTSEEL